MSITRTIAIAAAGLAIAGTATGITYAATSSSSGSVHACANSKGTLRLLDSHGHCPTHYRKVTINERGPRGETGPRGPAGPGPISLSVKSSTVGVVTKETKPIGGTDLTVEVLCDVDGFAQVYLNLNAPGPAFTFEGIGSYQGVDVGNALWQDPADSSKTVLTNLGPTPVQLSAEQAGDPHSVEFSAAGGTVAADLLVSQHGHLFSVQLGASVANATCWSHALVTPAG